MKIITDPPGGRLLIDGDDRGRTPAKLELEPGSHQIVIESGKATGSFTIDAGEGQEKFCYGLQGKKLAEVDCG
ncbi:MAG: PEGA domain-containing protein [Myxococcota bacterium]